MADRVGQLAIVISGDSQQFMKVASGVEEHIARMNSRINKSESGGGGFLGKIGGVGMGAIAAVGGFGLLGREMFKAGQEAVQLSRDYEVSEVQLKSLTGSAEQAKTVFKQLRDFAGTTPLETTDVSAVARKLLGSGIAQADAMRATMELTKTAVATGGELSSLARAYAQVTANGRFMTEELNQFADADFPIQEFAKTAGLSMAQMRADMEKGLVPVSVMADTFTRLTSETGRFGSALKDMMGTATGKLKSEISQHKDYIAEMGKSIDSTGISFERMWMKFKEAAVTVQASVAHMVTTGDIAAAMKIGGSGTSVLKMLDDIEAGMVPLSPLDILKQFLPPPSGVSPLDIMFASVGIDLEAKYREKMDKATAATVDQLAKFIQNSIPSQEAWKAFDNNPKFGGFRNAMATGDLDNAALAVQGMRNNLANKARIQLPSAATFGSSAAADTMNNAIAATMGQPIKDTADVLREMKKVEEKQQKDIEEIKTDLRNLKIARF
jgi:tape measure domain-containing protein